MEKRLENLKEQTKIINICKLALQSGGDIRPLVIPSHETGGDGLTNGNIINVDGKWLLNIRRVAYALFHSEKDQKFPSPWGPLVYFNPEDDITLRTTNYICELNTDNLTMTSWNKVDTSKLDVTPIWEFIGLEDVRLAHWDNTLYQTGVRRDTTPNGEGRMELSTVKKSGCCNWKETQRQRISTPDGKSNAEGGSYCEKNWMPINDLPYHYVKWTNPTEVVKTNPNDGTTEIVAMNTNPGFDTPRDMRGSSNVIRYKNMWVAIIHECDLWYDIDEKKDAVYHHRIVCWDDNWNIIKMSDTFNFMTGQVEFTCGIGLEDGNFLIPFGFKDHSSYILKLPTSVFDFLIGGYMPEETVVTYKENAITNFINDPHNGLTAFNLAEWYFSKGQCSSALGFYSRAAEYSTDENIIYQAVYQMANCLSGLGRRDNAEELMWMKTIEHDPERPEAYLALSRWYSWRNQPNKAYYFASIGMKAKKKGLPMTEHSSYSDKDLEFQYILFSSYDGKYDAKFKLLQDSVNQGADYPWLSYHADKWNIKKNI